MQTAQDCFDKIILSIEHKKLQPAFSALEVLVGQIHDWNLQEQLETSKKIYKTMLYYWMENSRDIKREKIYQTLLCSIYTIADMALWQIQSNNSSSFFYKERRIYCSSNLESTKHLLMAYKGITSKIDLSILDKKKERKVFIQEKENLHRKIFQKIWLSDHWSNNEKNEWVSILHSPNNENLACLIISAITLNLLETFDEKKINVLLDISYNEEYNEKSERALIGLILILRKYNYRLYLYRNIIKQLYELAENPIITKKICQILLQFILCKETEKITQKITSELIPEIIHQMKNKNSSFNVTNSPTTSIDNELEEKNPEWHYLIESSNMEEKLKEISEWQKAGADVMYSSFSHLKNYSFFDEISHWFTPFTLPNEAIGNTQLISLVELLETSSFLCHSDKYSFYLNVSNMPKNLSGQITKQFFPESMTQKENTQIEINCDLCIPNSIRQYIQDLYRFYNLHPKKQEYEDIFKIKPEFYQISWIYQFIKNKKNLTIIGEYYFNQNCFDEAIDIYNDILKIDPDNYLLYQKIGFCLQMKGQLQKALEAYQKAELFDTNHSWTIKKIAYLYRILKNPKEALFYYKKAEQLTPKNLSISLSIGHCYSDLEKYAQALKFYFKVEYFTEKKEKIWRLIGWCSLLIGNYSQASLYFNKVLKTQPNITDFINFGHVKWISGDIKEAIRLYRIAIKKGNYTYEDFSTLLHNDTLILTKAGLSTKTIHFVIDTCYLL